MSKLVDAPPVLHPLEPLSPEEISAASAILKAEKRLNGTARFVFVSLHEPPKAAVQAGETVAREAFVVLYEKAERKTYEAVVSLTGQSVTSFEHIAGVQPPVMAEEFMACEAIVQSDPGWQAAMRLRGIEDFSLAMIDPWAAGYTGPEDDPSERRIIRPLTWVRSEPGEHGYARPIEGLVVTVDLDAMEVVDVADHGVVELPPKPGNYDTERMAAPDNVPHFESPRAGLKPIEITQPEGASFTVTGHGVAWQKWHVRVGFTPREGLVLHELSYDERPIIYRASLAEMFVPYGDPAPTHRFKNVFDQGEYGVAYKLVPGENVAPMFLPDSRFARRAGFTGQHVWVTAYDPAERFAAGDYPNQHPGGDGVPRYAEADRPLEGTDVVLWYTFGAHHVVRPEDWPVMPVTHVGFKLKPAGFFEGNPALDMPPSKHCHHE